MQFQFLGTSAGMPTLQRNVTALAVSIENQHNWYLVDCGEGTQQRMLQAGLNVLRLKTIFITHIHGDHCYGLPGLLASANMNNRQEPLTVCAPAGIEEYVRAVFQHTDVHDLRYPLHFLRSDTPDFSYMDNVIHAEAIALSHRVPSFAYRIEERLTYYPLDKNRLLDAGIPPGPAWGELQKGNSINLDDGREIHPQSVCSGSAKKRAIIVGGDNDQPSLLQAAMQRSDVLIHEATFTESVLEKIGPKYMHSTAAAVAKAAQEAGIAHLLLTHISQRYSANSNKPDNSLKALRNEAEREYEGNLLLAEDMACYQLHSDGTLTEVNKQSASGKNSKAK